VHAALPTQRLGLRCALHCHTTSSDGEPTPAGLLEHYARAGWDAVAITDHHHVTRAEHPELVTIPAVEITTRVSSPAGECDVLAFGVETAPDLPADGYFGDIEACAAWIVGEGGVGYLAHPYYSGLEPGDFLAAPALSGIEVFNAGSELFHGNGLSAVHWDDLLFRGARPLAIASDDSHYAGQDSRLAWTTCLVEERSAEGILAALRDGSFYGSSGPELLEIAVDGRFVEVRCSPATSITLRSGPWDGCRVNADAHSMHWRGRVLERAHDGTLLRARFEPPEFHDVVRVEVEGAHGGTAWSNPFALAGADGSAPADDR
jgi:hypothetical protein